MTKRKFIIISFHQLSPRWINYYHMDELVGDVDIEYWDCSSWMENGDVLADRLNRPYCRVIYSEAELKENINGLKSRCCFRILNKFLDFEWLVEWLYENKSEFIMVEFIPPFHMSDTTIRSLISTKYRNVKHRVKDAIKKIFRKDKFRVSEPINTNDISSARQYVKNATLKDCYLISSNQTDVYGKEIFRINSPDYDQFLMLQKNGNEQLFKEHPTLPKGKYIVFLDNYFPYHSELFSKERGWEKDNKQRAQQYYAKINIFFDQIEDYYKMPVIIAAHPIANYTNNPYNCRLHICYRTAELIKDCYGVITSSSVSFSFAVLFKKPLILFTCREMAGTFMDGRILDISKTLGLPIHSLEQKNIRFDNPNVIKRRLYINNYMCGKETSRKFNVDLLREALIHILNK